MKKLFTLVIIFSSIILAYSGGDGSDNNPFQLSSLDDLIELRDNPFDSMMSFVLTSNIDFSDFSGRDAFQITNFSGNLDGRGYGIRNFDNTSSFFGTLENAKISNMSFLNTYLSSHDSSLGILAANSYTSQILNCSFEGDVEGDNYVSGIVGMALAGTVISNCNVNCSIYGNNYVGGIAGRGVDLSIISCSAITRIRASSMVGGLIGVGDEATITKCNSYHETRATNYVGGIAGDIEDSTLSENNSLGSTLCSTYGGGVVGSSTSSSIVNSFSTGYISGENKIGGCGGFLKQSSIINSYSTTFVVANQNVGGLVGTYDNSNAINSYWNVELSGQELSVLGGGMTSATMSNFVVFTDVGWRTAVWQQSPVAPFFPVLNGPVFYASSDKFSGSISWKDGDNYKNSNLMLKGKIKVNVENLNFFANAGPNSSLKVNGLLNLPCDYTFIVNKKGTSAKAILKNKDFPLNPQSSMILKLKKGILSYKWKGKNINLVDKYLDIQNVNTSPTNIPIHLCLRIATEKYLYYASGLTQIEYKTKQDKKTSIKQVKN